MLSLTWNRVVNWRAECDHLAPILSRLTYDRRYESVTVSLQLMESVSCDILALSGPDSLKMEAEET
jgi:hypothetical protein